MPNLYGGPEKPKRGGRLIKYKAQLNAARAMALAQGVSSSEVALNPDNTVVAPGVDLGAGVGKSVPVPSLAVTIPTVRGLPMKPKNVPSTPSKDNWAGSAHDDTPPGPPPRPPPNLGSSPQSNGIISQSSPGYVGTGYIGRSRSAQYGTPYGALRLAQARAQQEAFIRSRGGGYGSLEDDEAGGEGAAEEEEEKKLKPQDIVDEFKSQGHFDAMRKSLLTTFQRGPLREPLLSRIGAELQRKIEEDFFAGKLSAGAANMPDTRLLHADLVRFLEHQATIFDGLMEDLQGNKRKEEKAKRKAVRQEQKANLGKLGEHQVVGQESDMSEEEGAEQPVLANEGAIGLDVRKRAMMVVEWEREREKREKGEEEGDDEDDDVAASPSVADLKETTPKPATPLVRSEAPPGEGRPVLALENAQSPYTVDAVANIAAGAIPTESAGSTDHFPAPPVDIPVDGMAIDAAEPPAIIAEEQMMPAAPFAEAPSESDPAITTAAAAAAATPPISNADDDDVAMDLDDD